MAAAKDRGTILGGFRGRAGTCTDLEKARAVRTAKAKQRALDLTPTIQAIREAGATSLHSIAAALNNRGITAARGGNWYAAQVRSILSRIGKPVMTCPLLPESRPAAECRDVPTS